VVTHPVAKEWATAALAGIFGNTDVDVQKACEFLQFLPRDLPE
jgi:hypothetical protein